MSMRDELAALIHEHETRYERVSENDWRWACSCDEAYVPIFESCQDCKSQTERHWAEKLTERIERHVAAERAATIAQCKEAFADQWRNKEQWTLIALVNRLDDLPHDRSALDEMLARARAEQWEKDARIVEGYFGAPGITRPMAAAIRGQKE